MKIVDFEHKGNTVRYYLADDDVDMNEVTGDDWDDRPYEHNAGQVYDEYYSDFADVTYPFNALVLEPQDDWHNQGNSPWCKDDMKDRKVPCIIVVPWDVHKDSWGDQFGDFVAAAKVERIYFGDSMEPGVYHHIDKEYIREKYKEHKPLFLYEE